MENKGQLLIGELDGLYYITTGTLLHEMRKHGWTLHFDGVPTPNAVYGNMLQIPKFNTVDLVKTRTEKTGYVNREDNSVKLSNEMYAAEVEKLQATYDWDSEEWSSLDDEFAYKKYIAQWSPEYSKTEERISYKWSDFELYVPTESRYECIKPVASLIEDLTTEKVFRYTIDKYELLTAAVKTVKDKYGVDITFSRDKNANNINAGNNVLSVSTHSDLNYLKLGHEYINSNDDKFIPHGYTGSLEKCEAKMYENIERVAEIIYNAYQLNRPVPVDELTVATLGKKLKEAKRHALAVDSKVATNSSYNVLLKKLNESLKLLIEA